MSNNSLHPQTGNLRERSTAADKPFAWESRRVLYRIREKIGGTQAAYGISVYVALCVLASGAGKQTFSATIAVIGTHAGLRYKKTHEMLWLLEQAGVIAIQENKSPGTKANSPHTFTLLSLGSKKQKEVRSNKQEGLCPASNTSHTDSIKNIPEGEYIKKDKSAPPSSLPATPDGSGHAGGSKTAPTSTQSPDQAIGGTW